MCVCACVYWLVGWVSWHNNHCRLFNAAFIFIQINNSISNNSIKYKYTIQLSKTFLFQVMNSQTFLIQKIQFSISIVSVYAQLNIKRILFRTIQFSVGTVSVSKTVLFQTVQFSISAQFTCQNSPISSSSV